MLRPFGGGAWALGRGRGGALKWSSSRAHESSEREGSEERARRRVFRIFFESGMSARTDSRSKGEAGNPSSDISTANCSRRRLVVGGSPRAALCEYLTTESGGRGGGRVRGRGGTFFLHRWKANGGGCKSCGSSCVRVCSNYLFSIRISHNSGAASLDPRPRLR